MSASPISRADIASVTGIAGDTHIAGDTGGIGISVLAIGVVDAHGVRGSSGVRGDWRALGVAPPGTARTFRALFGRSDPTLRKLDRASRALVLAAEAAGLADILPREARESTALVLQTRLGCLDADLRFAACTPGASGAATMFPGTLPSAALGELALRYGLRGSTICLSIGGGDGRGNADVGGKRASGGEGHGRVEVGDAADVAVDGDAAAALLEAARLLEDGDASYVVTGAFEVLDLSDVPGVAPQVSAVIALLAATADSHASRSRIPWTALREARAPFALLAASLADESLARAPAPEAPSA